ncbi:MAG: sigma-70 family RNA polymerase sigma factor [Actinobacteria bacterium]|nr:MAG: sigma-70 family RNA polymerase sigma factor [Actinomycetota bacterium]
MSPWFLRRYRAERLLREEFERLQQCVTARVAGRLRRRGVHLDGSDLGACYAQAFQGLYAAALDGEEVADPSAWLTLVTFRRAIDEHRARVRGRELCAPGAEEHGDLAAALDDRARLRQLFEGLRVRLSSRELQAASLCYLQGLTRAEAAARMGVSQARMRKLMDGRPGRPGVAAKVGSLLHTISTGAWCHEQASLMRGLAYGVLDPAGERYQLAVMHRRECPACRAYVLSLRGLAAALPPAPLALHLALGAGTAGGALHGLSAGASDAVRAGVGQGASSGSTIGAAPAATTGAVSASGAFGAGAGGGWLLAGGPAAKLAAGCLLALGVGAGCIALGTSTPSVRRQAAGAAHRASHAAHVARLRLPPGAAARQRAAQLGSSTLASARPALSPSAHATREFGLEPDAPGSPSGSSAPRSSPARSRSSPTAIVASPSRLNASPDRSPQASATPGAAGVAAAREFSPG